MSKNCTKCDVERDLSRFFLDKKTLKYANICRECNNAKRREYLARPEVKLAKKQHDKEYNARPKVIAHSQQYQAKWYQDNREKKLRQSYENDKKRYENDPNFRIRKCLRSRLKSAVIDGHKSAPTMELLGCSVDYFRKWIEYQFVDIISWDNHGNYWHLDHVKPCASFDLTIESEQQKCFHWKNIRPLEKGENMSKSNKIDNDIINWQNMMVEEFLKENPLN